MPASATVCCCDADLMDDDDIAGRFRAVASRWDLESLRSEVAAVLDDIEPSRRPYVPTQLVRALDMAIDSYGGGG